MLEKVDSSHEFYICKIFYKPKIDTIWIWIYNWLFIYYISQFALFVVHYSKMGYFLQDFISYEIHRIKRVTMIFVISQGLILEIYGFRGIFWYHKTISNLKSIKITICIRSNWSSYILIKPTSPPSDQSKLVNLNITLPNTMQLILTVFDRGYFFHVWGGGHYGHPLNNHAGAWYVHLNATPIHTCKN